MVRHLLEKRINNEKRNETNIQYWKPISITLTLSLNNYIIYSLSCKGFTILNVRGNQMFRRFFLMITFTMVLSTMVVVNVFADIDDWQPLLDVAFEQNDLEMAVLVLVNDNNVPVSDIIEKARDEGFGYTRIVDALIETKLSCEQVMVDALLNDVPPDALFDSEKVSDDYDYTPEAILRFLVKELRFMALVGESLGEKDRNLDTRKDNLDVILRVCESLMDDEGYSQYDVMFNLCQAEASNLLIAETAEEFDVPQATTFKACPKHAEYGHAYISHDLPQEAYIVIGVDHLTIDDNSGRGVISPKRP